MEYQLTNGRSMSLADSFESCRGHRHKRSSEDVFEPCRRPLAIWWHESAMNRLPTTPPPEALVDAATRSIPGMVMDKFHNLPGEDKVVYRFYEVQGRGPNRIVRLTPDLQAVAASGTGLLDEELEPRWRIVEASFEAGIGRSLVRHVIMVGPPQFPADD